MIKLFSIIGSAICALSASLAFAIPVKTEARYGIDFQGGNSQGVTTRTVSYASRDASDYYVNPYKAPTFVASMDNSCVVNAGGNALVYYDRIYDELVPDYKHKYIFGGFYYGSQNDGINNMFNDLATRMGKTSSGVTVAGFLSGMRSYVASRSRNIDITQATGGYNNLDIEYIKTQLKQDKVAAMFMTTFSITSLTGISNKGDRDEIVHERFSGHHTVLVYGYKEIYYYDGNGSVTQRDTYFYTSTGYGGGDLGLINVNYYCNVDDFYILDIY